MMCAAIVPTARTWAVLACFVLISELVHWSGQARSAPTSRTSGSSDDIQAARVVLERFLQFEETEQYERCYDLLSSAYKASLGREDDVTNGREYKRMRWHQGLRWRHPKITQEVHVVEGGMVIVFTVKITFEQPIIGERVATDRIFVNYFMSKENGKWLVDNWIGT